jgi:uncharacterized membrane protein YiaA
MIIMVTIIIDDANMIMNNNAYYFCVLVMRMFFAMNYYSCKIHSDSESWMWNTMMIILHVENMTLIRLITAIQIRPTVIIICIDVES